MVQKATSETGCQTRNSSPSLARTNLGVPGMQPSRRTTNWSRNLYHKQPTPPPTRLSSTVVPIKRAWLSGLSILLRSIACAMISPINHMTPLAPIAVCRGYFAFNLRNRDCKLLPTDPEGGNIFLWIKPPRYFMLEESLNVNLDKYRAALLLRACLTLTQSNTRNRTIRRLLNIVPLDLMKYEI